MDYLQSQLVLLFSIDALQLLIRLILVQFSRILQTIVGLQKCPDGVLGRLWMDFMFAETIKREVWQAEEDRRREPRVPRAVIPDTHGLKVFTVNEVFLE